MKISDKQWQLVQEYIPKKERLIKSGGRPWCCPRRVLDGILWVVKSGARWCDLPKEYPSYQTCHRRFQKWVRAGVFQSIIHCLVRDLEIRGKIDLTETYIDATYVDAQKGGLQAVKSDVVTGPRSWQSQTVALFQSPLAYQVLHNMRVSSLIRRFGHSIQASFLKELWVTKLTILILSTRIFEEDIKSNLLLPISAIEHERQLRMDDLYEDTDVDGKSSVFLHGYSPFEESKSDTSATKIISSESYSLLHL